MPKKGIVGRSWVYPLLLVAVTVVRGWTFVVAQDAIALYGVIPFLAGRFVQAAAVLSPFYATKLTRRTLLVSGGIGVVLAAGYLFQTTGLLFTTPTNTGLVTGLFVVFAPLADRLLFGARLSRPVIVAAVLSLAGSASGGTRTGMERREGRVSGRGRAGGGTARPMPEALRRAHSVRGGAGCSVSDGDVARL